MADENCHLCACKLFKRPILQLESVPKAAQYFPEESELEMDEGITLQVWQCSSCGLVQLKREPVDYFKEVITAASFSERTRRTRLGEMKEFVERCELRGKRVLEVGSGKGDLLDVLAEAGVRASGIEASAKSVAHGRAVGRKMICGYIGDLNGIEGHPFDAFVSLNYLEHLPNPDLVIKRLYDNTTTDAAGFVSVPNLDYLLSSKCCYEFVADHLSYFTKNTLTYAFERNGFQVLECRAINEDNDIVALVKKREPLNISVQLAECQVLVKDLRQILSSYKSQRKRVAVWGAGHRTLALLALGRLNDIEYVVDSATFKQGRFTPVIHVKIVPPEYLIANKVGLVIVMVPGLYPGEVLETLGRMNVSADIAVLRGNRIEFIDASERRKV